MAGGDGRPPRDDDRRDEEEKRRWVERLLERHHAVWLSKALRVLRNEGHTRERAFDGFQTACVEVWRRPLCLEWGRLGDPPDEDLFFQLLLQRARWRAGDEVRDVRREVLVADPVHAADGTGRAEPDPSELMPEPDHCHWIAMNCVEHQFGPVCRTAIDRCLAGEPYRTVARETGVSHATLHRQVKHFRARYELLGRPDGVTFDEQAVARLRARGCRLVVMLESELDRDPHLRRCMACGNGTRAWICEVEPQ